MTNRKCLVTGGAGFIGCAISKELCDQFDEVVVVDLLHEQVHPTRTRPKALDERARLVVADVCDSAAWARLLADFTPSLVIHLAAETGTGQSLTEATRHAQVNVTGTAVMLDALSKCATKPSRIVLTSSRAVYGEGPWVTDAGQVVYPGQRSVEQLQRHEWDFPGAKPRPASAATSRPMPVSVYGATKLAQEHVLGAWCSAMGVEATVLRLQNVYGPGQSLSNPYTGIVSLFCRLAREKKSIPLYEDGAMLRDFVFIDDVAAMILRAASAPLSPHPIDVGTGHSVTIAEAARIIATLYDAPEPHVCALYRFGDVRHASCDIGDTVARFNWRPQIPVQEGIKRLSAWIEEQLPRAN
jgi:dTDP-L-rhamnose 4-epimerase